MRKFACAQLARDFLIDSVGDSFAQTYAQIWAVFASCKPQTLIDLRGSRAALAKVQGN